MRAASAGGNCGAGWKARARQQPVRRLEVHEVAEHGRRDTVLADPALGLTVDDDVRAGIARAGRDHRARAPTARQRVHRNVIGGAPHGAVLAEPQRGAHGARAPRERLGRVRTRGEHRRAHVHERRAVGLDTGIGQRLADRLLDRARVGEGADLLRTQRPRACAAHGQRGPASDAGRTPPQHEHAVRREHAFASARGDDRGRPVVRAEQAAQRRRPPNRD
jgi:hypothetical protein